MTRTLSSLAAITTVVGVSVFAIASPALAHVTVNPEQAEQGGFEELTFRVPNERDDAATTQLEVVFPQENPLTAVSVKPHHGWSYDVEMRTLDPPLDTGGGEVSEVVDRIVWTADTDEDAIQPGEYDAFSVSAGPMPEDVDQLVFPALQTYEGGEVVRWIETSADEGAELERPAPVLQLVPAASTEGETPAATPAPQTRATQPTTPASGLPLGLSIAALLAALAASAIAGLTWRRTHG